MISSGMSALSRWMCSATGRIFVLGEAAEGVLHQLEVVVEVAVARPVPASEARNAGSR